MNSIKIGFHCLFFIFFYFFRTDILVCILNNWLLLVNWYLVFSPCFSLTAHLFQLAKNINVFIDKLFGILRRLRKVNNKENEEKCL